MDKKAVRIIALIISIGFVVGLLFSAIYGVAYGATIDEQLKASDKKQKEAKSKLENVKKERAKTLESQEALARELIELQNKVNDISEKIDVTNTKLQEEEVKLDVATKEANIKYENFKERFRVVCEEGPVTYLELLFSAKNFSDFVDKIEVAQEIAENDKKIFDEMEAVRVEIENSRNEILALKQSQEESKNSLVSEKDKLNAKKLEQQQYIKSLEKDAAAYQRIIDEEERAMQALKNSISGSLSSSTSGKGYVGGEFLWPTPSCSIITSNFSPRRKNPVTGVYKRHTGVDIGASYGAAIIAANAGTVTLAGWNSGYGNCVVIDHGGGRATLYAHMSSIGTSKGQYVTKGQQIGKVGSTGNSTGPHLHFEILINGNAVDPMQYFR